MSFTIGQVVHNRYRIDALLGQGGMGAVYRAWDVNLNIPVALKEMTPDPHADTHTLAQLRQQFSREAQVVASLDHPNLVRVTDYFSWDGSECMVMNFVKGESLAERIEREGAQSETQVLEWARQLLDALAYCHAQGVIHRDVKPQNVIITPQGKPVLVDFGLVKLWDPRNPHTQTVIRAMGTPEYAPPEQYSVITGHTDPRSDLYSLGATLYHALTGQSPVSATDRMAMPERFVPPRVLASYVSPQTEAAILKAMELPITRRFSTAQEMTATLIPALPPFDVPVLDVPVRRHRKIPVWALSAGVVLLLGLLVGCIVTVGNLSTFFQWLGASSIVQPTPMLPPTSTPQVAAATSTIRPTSTPKPPTPTPPDPRVPAQAVVERFQELRTYAQKTGDTSQYSAILADSALESAIQAVTTYRDKGCYMDITTHGGMTFQFEDVTQDHVVVLASRSETRALVCPASTKYYCEAFDGYYVVDRLSDGWYITYKEVRNVRPITPCP
jgi:serine/threonine-protein kinase